jgi:phage shock protein C
MSDSELKKLTRSSSDRMISGVCGGLGVYFNIDSTLVRIIWVVLTLMGGAGILLYLAAILIIPLDVDSGQKKTPRDSDSRTIWGIILILLGIFFLLSTFRWHLFSWFHFGIFDLFWPIVIIVIGIALILHSTRNRQTAKTETDSRKMFRLKDDKMFLGVAGGIGKYFNIDLNLARLGFVLFILLSGGIGLIVYLILYFLMPEETSDSKPEDDIVENENKTE